MSKQHPDSIRYDKSAEETIILGANILITIFEFGKEHLVSIDNHNGFHTQWFYESTFGLLNHKVDVEAHRHRRGLKHEKKMHIRNFLTSVTEQQVENEKSMD
jgi:hypothetical protein